MPGDVSFHEPAAPPAVYKRTATGIVVRITDRWWRRATPDEVAVIQAHEDAHDPRA